MSGDGRDAAQTNGFHRNTDVIFIASQLRENHMHGC